MASVLRGEIYWADLDPTLGHEQSGHRPVLILSEDIFNTRSGTVIAVALTSQEPRTGYPLNVEVIGSGLPMRTWAKVGQVRTLSTWRLRSRMGSASFEEMSSILDALNEILGGN